MADILPSEDEVFAASCFDWLESLPPQPSRVEYCGDCWERERASKRAVFCLIQDYVASLRSSCPHHRIVATLYDYPAKGQTTVKVHDWDFDETAEGEPYPWWAAGENAVAKGL